MKGRAGQILRLKRDRRPQLLNIALMLAVAGVLLAALRSGLRLAPSAGFAQNLPAAPPSSVDFNRDIEPIFKANCLQCHGGENTQARLRLDSEAGVLKGGVSGAAIVPGHSGDSLLVKRLLGATDAPRMPMGGQPLRDFDINVIRAWIDQGSFPSVAARAGKADSSSPAASRNDVGGEGSSPVFATEIRPILAARCYRCHGPDVQQNGLRLDSLQALLAGSETGKIVVPGSSEKSRLMRRLLALDRPQMPYGGPPLPADQIDLIRHWIDSGAPGPDSSAPLAHTAPVKYWAYVPPVRPPLPTVKDAAWCRNPIDRFVLAKLEKEGLSPSPEADKETLLRRVSLDLIGLPPTIPEIDAFLADKSPNAYEKQVDRLLASPHYGERWARPWLDLARYADTDGYEKDLRRTAWEYRDWVINALNQDMSFKEFTIEQIAGDMLPHPTDAQLIATGFNRNTLLNREGGIDPEEYHWYALIDRVNTTASVWLGITLGCAQCHNHKFDPFTQKDYYRFLAFFDNTNYKILHLGQGENEEEEPKLELPTPAQAAESRTLRAQIADLQSKLDTSTPELEAAQTEWESKLKASPADWITLRPSHYVSAGGATLRLQQDGSILASGKNPQADTYQLTASTDRTGITGIRIEVLPDPSLPKGGPGRDPDGNFFLSAFQVEAKSAGGAGAAQPIKLKEAVADESQSGYEVENILKTSMEWPVGWAIDPTLSKGPLVRQAVLVPDKPFGFEGGTVLSITLKHEMKFASRNLGRFRLSVTTSPDPKFIAQIPAHLRPILEVAPAQRSADQTKELAAAYRAVSPLLQPARDQIAKLKKQVDDLGIVTAMVLNEKQSYERPSTYVHIRGAFLSPAGKVYADVPGALGRLSEDEMPNRLGLAQWLVDDSNPLTARVTVNRFWETLFGHGIVETSEDFGSQGDPPTHPELLDWLATEFMSDGWDMKKIQRLMVTSATFRQSSRITPQLEERDPYNKLLARGPRFRVEAETVRDIALEASGLLSPKIGGPSVFPYQPEGVWDLVYNDDKWVMSKGEDRYRRGIYTFVRRSAPYPSMVTFDAPSREFCVVRRVRTNTPLQALTTLNDPAFFEAAQALGRHLMEDAGPGVNKARLTQSGNALASSRNPQHGPHAGGESSASGDSSSIDQRVIDGFRRCTSREPTPQELDRIRDFYSLELARFQKDPAAAAKVIKGYEKASLDPAEQAAWTMVANVMLNLDETITKE
ncbi:MAG TPA: PSD1 and planctomycete cytochrome C domain-containing protein [Terriglobia bacterium]|nr:PSD1 and planctomycete cytochrome C domain-containing protein [Terriglobia bacterium]